MKIPNIHPGTGTRYDEPLYVSPSGRKFYPIGGAAEETPEEKAAREAAEAKAREDATKPLMYEGRLMTQDDLTKLIAKESGREERKAQAKLVETLGFKDLDEAQAFITAQREAEKAAMTEAERKVAEAAERERKAEEREKRAEERERAAERKDALRDLGASGDNLADALALLRVDDDADADAVADAAAKLKERRPELFGASSNGGGGGGGNLPDGGPQNRNQPPPPEWGGAGKAEAEKRYKNKKAAATT